MPYGIIREDTLAHVVQRAQESGISPGALGLEALEEDSNVVQLSVIYGGALDEEFFLYADHASDVARWVGELCQTESEADADHADWSIILTDPVSLDTVFRLNGQYTEVP